MTDVIDIKAMLLGFEAIVLAVALLYTFAFFLRVTLAAVKCIHGEPFVIPARHSVIPTILWTIFYVLINFP